MMHKLTQTIVESAVVMLVGLTITGALMFAFARNASANEGADTSGHVPAGYATTTLVQIVGNNAVLVRGAKVTAISDTTITAQTVWGNSALTWTVRTNGDTKYYRQNAEGAVRTALSIGDYVSFSGALDPGAAAFTVNAGVVRDQSLLATASSSDDRKDNDKDSKTHVDASWHSWFKGFSFGNLFGHKDTH